ncbi:MAG: hypothetical protein JWO06_220 [Bacteroidota bacterium]|nr:hypothetical protein [Bacteroidota bacterium]
MKTKVFNMVSEQDGFLADIKRLKETRAIVKDVEIVENTGFSKSVVSNYLSGRVSPSKNFLEKFYGHYGKYLATNVSEPNVKYYNKKENGNFIDLGTQLLMQVPLVNQYAYAGYLTGYGDANYMDELPKVPFIVDREYKGKYVCFEVRGDSMDDGTSDSYLPGDIALCREISNNLWKSKLHISKWDFIIVHKTEGILIKKITAHNVELGTLRLHSLNNLYEDFTINLKDVAQLFNVIKIERKK